MHTLAKYGVALTFVMPVIKRGVQDYALTADWTPATGDVKVIKDGTAANIGTLPAVVSGLGVWTFTLTATEMQAKEVLVLVTDAATKAVEDQLFAFHTFGHASAQHTGDLNNLDAAVTSRLAPTTASRTLDVSSGGEAGIDLANVGSPTTAVNLSGTTVKAVTDDVGITQTAADKVWGTTARTLTSFGTLIADIWAYATRLLTAGTNIVLAKGVGVTGFNDLSAVQVNAEADTALADYDPPTKAEMDSAHALLATPAQVADECDEALVDYDAPTKTELDTAEAAIISAMGGGSTPADIADAVWDELITGHLGGGSCGEALYGAGGGSSPSLIADAVWDEAHTEHKSDGSFGKLIDKPISQAGV